jgi:hypothetical protein
MNETRISLRQMTTDDMATVASWTCYVCKGAVTGFSDEWATINGQRAAYHKVVCAEHGTVNPWPIEAFSVKGFMAAVREALAERYEAARRADCNHRQAMASAVAEVTALVDDEDGMAELVIEKFKREYK